MKALVLGLAATLLIGVTADQVLDRIGFSSAERGSGAAVRLGD